MAMWHFAMVPNPLFNPLEHGNFFQFKRCDSRQKQMRFATWLALYKFNRTEAKQTTLFYALCVVYN